MSNLFAQRGLVIAVAWMAFTATASSTPLPNPLTLEQALALADESHPDIDFARAELALAQARQLESGGHYATRAYLDISAKTVDPSSGGGYLDDSRARLLVNRADLRLWLRACVNEILLIKTDTDGNTINASAPVHIQLN